MIILMTRLDCISEASRLAFAHMKPGTQTNHVMTADEYRVDIAAGKLYAHTWPGGVLFLRKRETYHMLSYYVNDSGSLPDCALPDDTFTEIAYKHSGAENAAQAVEYWGRVGMRHTLDRVRLTRPAGKDSSSPIQDICTAAQSDIDTLSSLMRACFSHRTGHIPDYQELSDSIVAGQILCIKDLHDKICGFLRWIPRAASIEIRQLAVRDDMRGKRLSHNLLAALVDMMGDKKITVWTRDGYAPALRSYYAFGFVTDGWRSTVLTF